MFRHTPLPSSNLAVFLKYGAAQALTLPFTLAFTSAHNSHTIVSLHTFLVYSLVTVLCLDSTVQRA